MQKAALSRSLLSLFVTLVTMGVLLFWSAGTFGWPLGGSFMATFVVAVLAAMAVLWQLNPEIFVARSRVQPGTKPGDFVFLALIMGGFVLILPVAGLDHRFGWSAVPPWAVVVGYALFLGSFAGQVWPQAVNRHFEPGVRIQTDRGHAVIDTGPYAVIRHPGYASGALLALSIPLMLGSWWAFVPAIEVVAALAARTPFEERVLCAELPGYAAYARRVPYRWFPGVW